MPNAWTLIDSSFPAFTGKERIQQQIPVILDYMFMLSEGLKYQLSNLNTKNWNSNALENLKIETTEDLVKQMTAVTEDISVALDRLNALTAQILQMEMDVGNLEKSADEHKESLTELDERLVTAEGSLQALEDVILPDGEGGAVIGADGKTIHLKGKIYINGVLME